MAVATDRDDEGFFFFYFSPRKGLSPWDDGSMEVEGYCCGRRSVAHREERDANYKIAAKTCVREYNHYKRDVVVVVVVVVVGGACSRIIKSRLKTRVCVHSRGSHTHTHTQKQ